MSLTERVRNFRLARRRFLDEQMPPRGEDICLTGILVRPLHEFVATYEALYFRQGNSPKPRAAAENVAYLYSFTF